MQHWTKKPLSQVARKIQSGGTPKADNPDFYGGDIPFVSIEDITDSRKFLGTTQRTLSIDGLNNSSAWIVPPRSVLYSIYATLGVPIINTVPVATSQAILAFIPDATQIDIEFLYYWLDAQREKIINLAGHTTQSNLSAKIVRGLEILLPPVPEQTRIAEILATVDRALATTSALINKHERIKTGLMQDLLSRGLDENGHLRDPQTHRFQPSLLGDIPEDWDVVTLGQVLGGIKGGRSPDCPDEPAQGDEWGILKVSAVGKGIFLPHENKRVLNSSFINSNYQVNKDDLLISRSNTPELVGLACLVEEQPKNLMLCDKTLRLEVNRTRIVKFFLNKVLATPLLRSQIEIAATGSSGSMKNLSQPAIRSLKFALPKREEQDRIVAQIQAVEHLISSHQTQLFKLQRLKAGLMADLLSGRVPVATLGDFAL